MRKWLRSFLICALTPFTATSCDTPSSDLTEINAKFSNTGEILNEDDILVFIGRKVFVERDKSFPPEPDENADEVFIYLDGRYKARYEIIDITHGKFESRFIDFYVYDHYGTPKFSKHDIVQLYVHEYDGKLVHEKYMWDQVYPASNGKWAACGNAYEGYENRVIVKPLEKIPFSPKVTFKISDFSNTDEYDQDNIASHFSEPIFSVSGDTATCQLGVYSQALYEIQKQSVLKARNEE